MTSTRITEVDERELRWFFSEGQASFESSPMGPMLERQKLFATGGQYDAGRNEILAVPHKRRHGQYTARVRGDHSHGEGYEPDHSTLMRYADVSGRLKRMEAHDREAPGVLELFYGDRGHVWARIDPPGRLAALYVLTLAGSELLERARRRAKERGEPDLGLSEQQQMENEVAAQKAHPNPDRHALLMRASGQAKALYADAARLWNAVG